MHDQATTPSPRPFRARIRSLTRLAAWLACIVGTLTYLLPLVWATNPAHESAIPRMLDVAVFGMRTFEFHIGVALVLVSIAALVARSLIAGILNLALAVVLLAPTAPLYLPGRGGHATGSGPTLTVLSVNALYGRTDIDTLRATLDRVAPDVVLIQEFTPEFAVATASLFAQRFPHRLPIPRDDAFGQAVFNRLPFESDPTTYLPVSSGITEPHIRARVIFDGHPVNILNVHTSSPTALSRFRDQFAQGRAIERFVAEQGDANDDWIIAGDFNCVARGPTVERLIDLRGFVDTHTEVGQGRASSWPHITPLRHLPGFRIDHILYRPVTRWTPGADSSLAPSSLTLRAVDTGLAPAGGSDHAPIWARFQRVSW